ncbi:hypothetical protein V6N11_029762, partial [Hibiscus sabdariffa]
VLLPWHASFLLVPRFAFLRTTVWLLALGDTAQPRYRSWLRAPLPKRTASWPRGRLSVVEDDEEAPAMVDYASEGPSVPPDSAQAAAPALVPEVPAAAAHATRTPPAPVVTPDASLRGPSASSATADLVGEAVDVPSPGQDAPEVAADRSTPDDAPYDPMPPHPARAPARRS